MKTHQTIHRTGNGHHGNESNKVVQSARRVLEAAAHNAEEKVVTVRKQLASAMKHGKAAWQTVQTKTAAGAKATDQAIRHHPYQSLGVALGVGAVTGYFLRRKN